ncbi:lactonase family protein [Peribacillus deserti]|uniref:6-phosphogluconolactonase n=1 Tax=Peribacillus deserti TaxID=673318 RepID=A0A2N5M3X8_9BACI|nr:lactonase family protein [Peribacillus deserti]PLT29066.1 6-phosphogluconolactonase [Peribacillus deserti]
MTKTNFIGYVGTYTKGDSQGIYSFSLDTEAKKLSNVALAAELGNPTYVNVSKDNRFLYSVAKAGDKGGVAAYSVNEETGALRLINQEVSDGSSPCHVDVNADLTAVVSANYHNGTVDSYVLNNDGSLNPVSSVAAHEGSGPNKDRQEKPHAHYSGFTPDQKYIAVIDLGIDKLITYQLAEDGTLSEVSSLSVKAGSGPRHLSFHPNGKFAYLMTELSNEVIVLSYNQETGEFKEVQYISAIPADFNENSQGSAIHVSSDGRFVYAGNRGHDSIAVFRVNEESFELTLVEYTSTEGSWPRDFVLDPSEKFLIASNQESSNLVLYERDETSGKLTVLQSDVTVPYPVCVKFLNA